MKSTYHWKVHSWTWWPNSNCPLPTPPTHLPLTTAVYRTAHIQLTLKLTQKCIGPHTHTPTQWQLLWFKAQLVNLGREGDDVHLSLKNYFHTGEYCESMLIKPKSINANNIHQHLHLCWISKVLKGSLSHSISAATGTASKLDSQSQRIPNILPF